MKLILVEHRGPIGRLVSNAVIFPAKSCRQRERRGDLPFVLEVGHVKRAPQPVTAPWSDEGDIREGGGCHVSFICEAENVVLGLPLIERASANLQPRLDGRVLIDPSVVRANLDVGMIIFKTDKVGCAYRKWKRAGLRVVKGRAIDINLGFVE